MDVLVNATSIGLYLEIDAMPAVRFEAARPDLLVCDVVPNPPEARLIRTARALGFNALTGLAMLVYQGAIGFEMDRTPGSRRQRPARQRSGAI